jgi:hypothetical protein
MSSVEQIVPWVVRHGNTLLFGLIWVTITAAAAIYVVSAVGRVAAPMSQNRTRRPINLLLMQISEFSAGDFG